jgi:molybdate transport system substrate-binding protein
VRPRTPGPALRGPRGPGPLARRLAVLVLALPVAACGGHGAGDDTTLTVLAAASLTGTFTDLADRFERKHPGVRVDLAFDSSATLARQAVEGAPGDVLATADTTTMDGAQEALDGDPRAFATNTMVLVTPGDNPAGIRRLTDLGRDGVTWVACVRTAPCGAVAAGLLAENHVAAEPASLEVDVKAVLAKVVSDEADAGLVYRTDAVAAGDGVRSWRIPGATDRPTTYPIALLSQAEHPGLAAEFVDLVTSAAGRRILDDAGFGTP